MGQQAGRGPAALRRAIQKRGLSYQKAVDRLAVQTHRAHLHRVAWGKREPDFPLSVAIEREFGVPVEQLAPSLAWAVHELCRLRGTVADSYAAAPRIPSSGAKG